MKQVPTPHRQHTPQHNKSNSFGQSRFGQSRFGESRFGPKSVLAKVGLAKLGRQKSWPKSVWPQSVWPKSAMTGTSQMLRRQAGAAQILIQELSRRVGSLPVGTSIHRIVREQRWSPLNVPLMCAAAGLDASTPVLDWLIHTIANCPAINFNDGLVEVGCDDWVDVVAHSNAIVGCHNGTRSLSVVETSWISRPSSREPHVSESPRVRVGGSLSIRRRLGSGFRRHDVRVRDRRFQREQPNDVVTGCARDQGRSQRDPIMPNLDFFDDMDLEELFAEQVQCKSCQHFFLEGGCATVSGSRRSVTGQKEKVMSWGRRTHLEALRFGAQNVGAQSPWDRERGPTRIRHERRTSRQGQVARIVGVSQDCIPTGAQKRQSSRSEERRGTAAQERVQKVSRAMELVGSLLAPKKRGDVEGAARKTSTSGVP